MFHTLRDALRVIRESIGTRNTLAFALVILLASPFLAAFLICAIPCWLVGAVASWSLRKLRGAGKQLDDPVFGTMTYAGSSFWTAERKLEALGGTFQFIVHAPATGPGPAQHALLHGLVARQHDLRQQLEESLSREYLAFAPQLRQNLARLHSPDLAARILEGVPVLTEPPQIWSLLRGGSISLEGQPGAFTMSWISTWDEEHGVSRSFVDWQLAEDEES